jgi:type IV secretion system protein TrbL
MGAATSTAYRLGQETSGSASVGAGLRGVARAGAGRARGRAESQLGLGAAVDRGRQAALGAQGGGPAGADGPKAGDEPAWARRLRGQQNARHYRQLALHAVREGDRGSGAANPDISEKEDRG